MSVYILKYFGLKPFLVFFFTEKLTKKELRRAEELGIKFLNWMYPLSLTHVSHGQLQLNGKFLFRTVPKAACMTCGISLSPP